MYENDEKYSDEADMSLGDLVLPEGLAIDKQKYIDQAADFIDSKIGYRYVLPLVKGDIAEFSRLLLKRISNSIAQGNLLLSYANYSVDSGAAIIRWARSLVNDAESELEAIVNGQTLIVGAIPADIAVVGTPSGPIHRNADPHSAVDTFYDFAMGSQLQTPSWRPGK